MSLWKYVDSLKGAILAGPAAILDGMFNVRRMFGGALWNAWPFALLARHNAEGFVDRLKAAISVSGDFIRNRIGQRADRASRTGYAKGWS